jgi:asparagine synthase (glutamine-hydrolysing)
MCGIAGIFGRNWQREQLDCMVAAQKHRGPDNRGFYVSPTNTACLGHGRLSIIDLSTAGRQPMADQEGAAWIAFNGEIYNYVELREELAGYPFSTQTDTEVILAAYRRWGERCLERFVGMFAFMLWDERNQILFAARDRFGVKPLYYHLRNDGTLFVASEIKALHAAAVPSEPNDTTWATYLTHGAYDHSSSTFWRGIEALPPGSWMRWEDGGLRVSRWYDIAERVGSDIDARPWEDVAEEYWSLLSESVRLRFRSDVAVGINLSGGVDSSILLAAVQAVQGADSAVEAFTFVTGDSHYDELPWVKRMLAQTNHPHVVCPLAPDKVPQLAESVQYHQDEPFGGLPTLAYAQVFEHARSRNIIVLLDGQGMDEQWAGYDYYRGAVHGSQTTHPLVQGAKDRSVRPECLTREFRALAEQLEASRPFPDELRNLQYRDICCTKIPRALRFNDRISMRSSTELREPFLDHRLVELAMRQRTTFKICNGTQKWLLRHMARKLLPADIVEAPKRPVQTPQREWLRGPLRSWASACITRALKVSGGSWLDAPAVRSAWSEYCAGHGDNSFHIWQWITLGMMLNSGASSYE